MDRHATMFCLALIFSGCSLNRIDLQRYDDADDCPRGRHTVGGRLVIATYDPASKTASGTFVMPEEGEGEFRCSATYACSPYQIPATAKEMGANAIFEGSGPINMCTREFWYTICHIEFFSDSCPDQPSN